MSVETGGYSPEVEEEEPEAEETERTPGRMARLGGWLRRRFGGGSESTPSYTPEGTYTPSYTPESYTPPTPEMTDLERRALEEINALARRNEERARERYKGTLLGKARYWANREGTRRQAEILEAAGQWQKNSKLKKWGRIGLKVAGGFGLAAGMIFGTGGGAILTPMLWSGGMREGFDGLLEAGEELGWGRGRSKAEQSVQGVQTAAIEKLKEAARSGDAILYQRRLNEMLDAERTVIGQQETNIKGERKGKLIRGIASTVATVGVGIFSGVPLGTHDYDKGFTPVGDVFLDQSHRVMWNLHGGHFLYNSPEEITRVAGEVAKHGYQWTQHFETYGQMSHMLGHGLPAAEKVGLIGAGAYLVGRNIMDFFSGRRKKRGEYYTAGYGAGEGAGVYRPGEGVYAGGEAPGGTYTPERPEEGGGGGAEIVRSPETDREAISRYLETLSEDDRQELEGFAENMSPMSKECIASVCIPVAYSEHRDPSIPSKRGIYDTLLQYLHQKESKGGPELSKDKYEITLFVNGPADKADDIRQTIEEIQKFQADHPEVQIRFFSKTFPERGNIGEIRKCVNDLALLRSQKRPEAAGPLVLVSNDADLKSVEEDYLTHAVSEFSKNPRLEMIAGKVDYTEEDYKKYPYLLAARRLWQFLDIAMRHRRYSDFLPKTLGTNMFMRAETYAKAGGYQKDAWVAEDLKIASDVARISGAKAVEYRNIGLTTDPRRDIHAIERGLPIIRSYDGFGSRESLRERVSTTHVESLRPGSRIFKKRLEKEAGAILQETLNQFFYPMFNRNAETRRLRTIGASQEKITKWERKMRKGRIGKEAFAKANHAFGRAVDLWGAKYRVQQDLRTGAVRVQITEMARLRRGLTEFGR